MHSSRTASASEEVEHQVKESIEKLFRMAESEAGFLWRKLGGGVEDNDAKHCSLEKHKTHKRYSLWNFWAGKELYEQLGGGVRGSDSGSNHEDIVVGWIQKYLRKCHLHEEIAEKEDEQMMMIRVGRKIKRWFKKNMKPSATASANVQSNFDLTISCGCVSFHTDLCVKRPLWCKSLLN